MTATTHQALYRRWRAQTFSEIVGQDAVVTTLRNAVQAGRVSHALLFTGPRGTGKTSLARIVAKALNCTDLRPDGDPCDRCPSCTAIRDGAALDVIEIDAASNRGINEVRELRERLAYAPVMLRRKVYILDEAHQITRDAWAALLKSLEEPPEFVTFMFASTHPQDFPPAILSRLQRFDVRRLTEAEIAGKLERILAADGRGAEPAAIDLIARLAAGGMRDAESILDQLLSTTAGTIEASVVRDLMGLADAESVGAFVEALATGDAGAGIAVLDALEQRGRDLRVFLDQVVDSLRERLLAGLGERSGSEPAIVAAAHRLAAIDPTRIGPGGLRLQLELALLASGGPATPSQRRPVASAPAPAAAPGAAPEHQPAPATPARAAAAEPAPEPAPATPARAAAAEPAPEPAPATPARAAAADAEPAPKPAPAADPETAPAAPTPARAPATEPAPAAEPVPVMAPPASGTDLDRLRHGWASVIASSRPATKPLVSECRPMSVEGAVVTLGFPEAKAFLKDIAERKRSDLESIVGEFLGRPVTVRCVATNLELVPPVAGDDEGTILAEARRIFADDMVDVGEVG